MHWLDNATLAKRATAEAAALAPFLTAWNGRLAVQVGVPDVAFALPERFGQRLMLAREGGAAGVRAAPEQLPLPENCVDALFLVHVLEEAESAYAVLTEAARVLRGEGRLIVIGFRSFSVAGISRAPARLFRPRGRVLGPFRLRLLLGRAGFVWEGAFGLGCSPLERWLPGQWRHVLAASYAAIGRKRVEGMVVLRPAWPRSVRKRRHAVLSGHGHAG